MSLSGTIGINREEFSLVVPLDVEGGEVLGLVGRNGAGKTTVLRAVAGLERLNLGALALDDQILDDAGRRFVPAFHRSVGMVFAGGTLFPHLDALENVSFGVAGGRQTKRREATAWLERFGVAELRHRRPDELSRGQAHKVALARAFARRPRILLLDEPTAALDKGSRPEVRALVAETVSAMSTLCIVASHDVDEILQLCSRVLVLDEGRVKHTGTPQDLLASAALVVEPNVVPGDG
ncbi:MAG: ATP-binding cassette domain-containing protein [Actinomycetes bacterium]